MRSFHFFSPNTRVILPTIIILITALAAAGQSSQPGSATPAPSNSPTATNSPTPSTNSPSAASTPSPGNKTSQPSSTPNHAAPTATSQSQPTVRPTASTPATVTQTVPTQSAVNQTNNLVAPAQAVVISSASEGTSGGDAPQVNPAVRRIERARALAAVHQLQQASTELENVRVSVNDVALRNVTTLMLIGIYLEEGNYARSQALLEESFRARAAQKDESLRTYFAMAGQTVNGLRAHLARYRSFGINPSERGLPAEANVDLERVRGVLECVAAQAKEISNEAGRSYDAVALQEDVVGIRLSIARDDQDRDKWQTEHVAIRERLASSQVPVTSIGRSALLDVVTAKIPNPFAKPADTSSNQGSTGEASNTATAVSPVNDAVDRATPQLISTGLLNGRESKRVTPVYPGLAKSTGVSGTVRVFAIIDENGKVWVTNSEGPTLLRKAAEDAAKNWNFLPPLVGGKPVRLAGYLDFEFKL